MANASIESYSRRCTREDLDRRLRSVLLYNEKLSPGLFITRIEARALYQTSIDGVYQCFDSFSDFIAFYTTLKPEEKMLHEVIKPNVPRKAIFDIDGGPENLKKVSERLQSTGLDLVDTGVDSELRRRIFRTIIDTIKRTFTQLYNHTLTDENIVICDSSNASKFSRHVIITGYHFANTREFKCFSNAVAANGSSLPEFICYDGLCATNRFGSVRLTGSHKTGSPDRKKRIISNHRYRDSIIQCIPEDSIALPEIAPAETMTNPMIYSDAITKNVMRLFGKHFNPKDFMIRGWTGSLLTLDRVRVSHCPLCMRDHESDGMYIALNGNKVYVRCFGYKHQGYTTEEMAEYKMIGKLDWPVPMLDADNALSQPPMAFCPLPNATEYSSDKVREYDFSDADTLLIRSGVGTEKTKALMRYIEREKPERIVMISCRCSFTNEIRNRMPYLEDYREIEGPIRATEYPKVIVQYESLHRYQASIQEIPDLLILDESESILDQMGNPVLKKHFRIKPTFAVFSYLLKNSKRVIAMDATLDERTVNLLTRTRKKIRSYINTKPSKSDTSVTIIRKVDQPAMILTDLMNGRRIVLCSNVKKYARSIAEYVREQLPDKRVKIYTGDDSAALKAEQKDVNTHWSELDLLIYTSTITVGCSFEREWYDRVYGYFTDKTNSVRSCIQMLGRIRDVKSRNYIIAFDNTVVTRDIPSSIEDLTTFVLRYHERLNQIRVALGTQYSRMLENLLSAELSRVDYRCDDSGKPLPHIEKDLYYYVHLYNVREKVECRNRFVSLMINHLRAQGQSVTVLFETVTQTLIDQLLKMEFDSEEERDALMRAKMVIEEANSELKEISAELTKRDAEELASARQINNEEYEVLKENIRTREDELAFRRMRLAKYYQVDPKCITAPFVEKYNKKNVMKQFKHLNRVTALSSIGESLTEYGKEVSVRTASTSSVVRLNTNTDYLRATIAIEALNCTGLYNPDHRHFDTMSEISREELEQRLKERLPRFISSFDMELRHCYRKSKRSLSDPQSWALRRSLQFINGLIRSYFGISIKRYDRNGSTYTLALPDYFRWNEESYAPIVSGEYSESDREEVERAVDRSYDPEIEALLDELA